MEARAGNSILDFETLFSDFQELLNGSGLSKGGPEPLEKESHEFLGSKRDDRFSNPFI